MDFARVSLIPVFPCVVVGVNDTVVAAFPTRPFEFANAVAVVANDWNAVAERPMLDSDVEIAHISP